ncbi:glucan biosynthesis protein [Devosia naphthalenivorans]|uniref:glucan biosynthesis protein n=1 Tax=Devosia naphthalenivorans TaxID=2082392 RepID=UPI001FE3ACD3|nr:glucan biosynthesis protein [Devosia naphthalenivorans]
MKRHPQSLPNRRAVLFGGGAAIFLMSSTALHTAAFAQEQEAVLASPFDFDLFTERMKDLAALPYEAPSFELPDSFKGLDYDAYRRIQFRPDHALWADDGLGFQVHTFHPGWLFKEPVKLFELKEGMATPVTFGSADFDYHDETIEKRVAGTTFPGVAGIRINYPLNAPDRMDELVTFLGASYFRALGRDNVYGLSARGLLMNSWLDVPEEFPRFSEFYVERPSVAGGPVIVYAALESPSVTGAYRFAITPGSEAVQATVMDVTARLNFRKDVKELGIAPLTSMFLYAEANRAGFDDYRPQVHDSNGLLIERETGEVMWRALNNSPALGNSYLWENSPKAFGLYQRGRDFEAYQDAGAHYERRPSLRVEPTGSWGQGSIRLIEIPAELEVDDNIGAFWIPAEPALAGQSREFGYRLLWGDLNPDTNSRLAYVAETRSGAGGVSGVENATNLRKFVVDFEGGELADISAETPPDVVATVSGGVAQHTVLSRIDANGAWRLVFDVETDETAPLELRAYLIGSGRQLTETWLYQWRPAA